MTQYKTVPEYILEEKSEKISQFQDLINRIDQKLIMAEVDLVVLSRQLQQLVDLSGRTVESYRDLRLSLQEPQ